MRKGLPAIISLGLLSAAATSAPAQDFPSRPVSLMMPYAAGGPGDTVGRIMAAGLRRG